MSTPSETELAANPVQTTSQPDCEKLTTTTNNNPAQCPTLPPCEYLHDTSQNGTDTTTSGEDMDASAVENGATTIVATIGVVAALLLVLLVGVTIGWVLSCHKNKNKLLLADRYNKIRYVQVVSYQKAQSLKVLSKQSL